MGGVAGADAQRRGAAAGCPTVLQCAVAVTGARAAGCGAERARARRWVREKPCARSRAREAVREKPCARSRAKKPREPLRLRLLEGFVATELLQADAPTTA